jgi:hypothetical protein
MYILLGHANLHMYLFQDFIFVTTKTQLRIYTRQTLSKEVSFDSKSADIGAVIMYKDYTVPQENLESE